MINDHPLKDMKWKRNLNREEKIIISSLSPLGDTSMRVFY